MSKPFGKVALLLGGDSPEREVSLASSEMVGEALEELCQEVVRFDPAERPLVELGDLGVERVFNILHGGAGEDGRVQATLEFLGLPFTGSRYLACALALDKDLSKMIWHCSDVPTPMWQTVTSTSAAELDQVVIELGDDLFVKPNNGGSSVATCRVYGRAQLEDAVKEALQVDKKALIEQRIEGVELTYGVLDGELLPGIRIEVPAESADTFYDYKAKYELDTTKYVCPPNMPERVEEQARRLSKEAFDVLGCSGWGRVDLMVAGLDVYILEINTVPGMTSHSLVPKAAAVAGIDNVELVKKILAGAQ